MMETNAFYHERMPFHFIYYITAFLVLISAAMLGVFLYGELVAPLDEDPAFGIIFLVDSIVIGGLSFFVLQFVVLELLITPEGIILKYGRIKKTIRWTDIESYSTVSNPFLNSGGWKFNLGSKGWYETFTVFNKSQIALELRTGRIKEVIFSTGNPQEVLQILKKYIGKDADLLRFH
jgi:hypothetical protein